MTKFKLGEVVLWRTFDGVVGIITNIEEHKQKTHYKIRRCSFNIDDIPYPEHTWSYVEEVELEKT